jgi:hypothetical protein
MTMERSTSWRWGAPRLLTRQQVRAYLQVTDPELSDRMKAGHIPGPLWGSDAALANARWDRTAIDRALDRASAIPSHIDAAMEELDRGLGLKRA